MQIPQGFGSSGDKSLVCRLHKSLYGLQQASRQWNLKLTSALIGSGFTQSHLDYSLFTKKVAAKIVMVLVYVDDILIIGDDSQLNQATKLIGQNSFRIIDLGELRFFLGIEFARSEEGMLMH